MPRRVVGHANCDPVLKGAVNTNAVTSAVVGSVTVPAVDPLVIGEKL
jgi:hypothetical protein